MNNQLQHCTPIRITGIHTQLFSADPAGNCTNCFQNPPKRANSKFLLHTSNFLILTGSPDRNRTCI